MSLYGTSRRHPGAKRACSCHLRQDSLHWSSTHARMPSLPIKCGLDAHTRNSHAHLTTVLCTAQSDRFSYEWRTRTMTRTGQGSAWNLDSACKLQFAEVCQAHFLVHHVTDVSKSENHVIQHTLVKLNILLRDEAESDRNALHQGHACQDTSSRWIRLHAKRHWNKTSSRHDRTLTSPGFARWSVFRCFCDVAVCVSLDAHRCGFTV